MNLYIEYEIYKRKYYEAQQKFDVVLSEKEEIFSITQPKSTVYDKEKVSGGTPSNTFEEYVIKKEKKQIDERLEEVKSILSDRNRLLELKLDELKESKNIYDKIYVCRYISKMKVFRIGQIVGYSEPQIYRILKTIKQEINKLDRK